MFDLILSNALLKGRRVDVAVRGTRFAAVEPVGALAAAEARERIDCARFLLRPPFYNTHTHQAMTLLRGIDDDCALMDWLTRVIWPREARLTPESVYAGTRLAILEGIKCGCVGFNDMYFHQPAVIRAASEMGVRARVGLMYMDQVSDHIENDAAWALRDALPPPLGRALAPHARYTTPPGRRRRGAGRAHEAGRPLPPPGAPRRRGSPSTPTPPRPWLRPPSPKSVLASPAPSPTSTPAASSAPAPSSPTVATSATPTSPLSPSAAASSPIAHSPTRNSPAASSLGPRPPSTACA